MRGEAISFHRLAYRALSQKGLQYFKRNRDWFEGELDPKFGSGSEKEKFVSSELSKERANFISVAVDRFDYQQLQGDLTGCRIRKWRETK